MSFFDSPEFKFLKKLRDHLEKLNTENNYDKYQKHLDLCRNAAKERYDNIGWREDLGDYAWAIYDESKFGKRMVCLGDFNDVSFYPGQTLYMSQDFTCMSLKDQSGKVWKYTEEETREIKDYDINSLKKIHNVKTEFEGSIISGDEKREFVAKHNQEKIKRFR